MGKLVVIEGIDGIGKATALQNIRKLCLKEQVDHAVMSFPMYGTNVYARTIEKHLRSTNPMLNEPMYWAVLYASDRYFHKQTLNKSLEDHQLVILDRYVASNLAYQAARYTDKEQQKLCRSQIYEMEHYDMALPKPDLYTLLYESSDVAYANLQNELRGPDKNEKDLEYLKKVQEQYIYLYEIDKESAWHVIHVDETTQSGNQFKKPEKIAEEIWQVIKKELSI